MTSGEWDLCALKALEEEEQKEFLSLSQKNLFESSSPPGLGSVAKPALTYAQLHPHLLKLPTIDECQLIASARRQSSTGTRFKFSRALSLSAHSLVHSGGGGGGGFGKKLKARLMGAKSSGSLSPSRHSCSVSPIFTPPPTRRCSTLHHTQPVRKSFKALQQLDRQKQERRQEPPATAAPPPQLRRIAGTNKTFWKYGANSTAASIIGQHARRQQLRPLADFESNTSDELNSETEAEATETGSCSVPLPAADSNELLRLMLTAASSAVAAAPAAAPAATGGPAPFLKQTPPHRFHHVKVDVDVNIDGDGDGGGPETVAYEAFYAALGHRQKSFALLNGGRALLRDGSLTAQESPARKPQMQSTSASSGRRKVFKFPSMDAAGEYWRQQVNSKPLIADIQAVTSGTVNQLSNAGGVSVGLLLNNQQTNEARYQHQHQLQQQEEEEQQADYQQEERLGDIGTACYGHGDVTMSLPDGDGAIIDDELEQHIKHCSCTCNHMGYGNSMDYQKKKKDGKMVSYVDLFSSSASKSSIYGMSEELN